MREKIGFQLLRPGAARSRFDPLPPLRTKDIGHCLALPTGQTLVLSNDLQDDISHIEDGVQPVQIVENWEVPEDAIVDQHAGRFSNRVIKTHSEHVMFWRHPRFKRGCVPLRASVDGIR
mmetsp:Transcript_74383/g.147821  ORF Transcript_74383/g.147821 Transcript_74383/m.147821 type:complete len:119 (+) Transcript_74383:713-1069(+)